MSALASPTSAPASTLTVHYRVDLPDTMAALLRIAADSHGIVLPMHDRSVYERYADGIT
ncbi:MAG: hypothetical protein QOG11_531 [Solirubrobacteraceae bacterium]|nr:hypothetical protein [Solirubrobacteraceae bacterium]